jgi:hypothetical protein
MANQNQVMNSKRTEMLNKFINIAVMLVLTAGSVAMVLPSLASQSGMLFIEDRYLPPFFLGLVAIAVLFNIYLFSQKWAAHNRSNRQRTVSLVDPLTQLLSNTLGMNHNSEQAGHLG